MDQVCASPTLNNESYGGPTLCDQFEAQSVQKKGKNEKNGSPRLNMSKPTKLF